METVDDSIYRSRDNLQVIVGMALWKRNTAAEAISNEADALAA